MKFCVGTNCHQSTYGKLSVAADWPLWISNLSKRSKSFKRSHCNARKCIFETKCVKHKIKTEGNQKKLREPEVAEELYLWRSFRFFSKITVEMKHWEADGLCSLYTSRWLSLGFSLVTIVKKRKGIEFFFFAKMADNFLCLNGFMYGGL